MYRRENLLIFQESRKYPLSSGFFLPKMSDLIDSSMVDRAGQLRAGRNSWNGILTPVRSATIIVRNNGGRFKTYQEESMSCLDRFKFAHLNFINTKAA